MTRPRELDLYRKHVAERGDKPRCPGEMVYWSLSRRESERHAAERGGCKVEKVTR